MARNSPNSSRPTLQHLVTPPILAYPDFSKLFILYTVASGLGLGCALFQFQDEKLRVIGFGSRTLVSAELKHHSSKLQSLALNWAVCEHFRNYIFYVPHFDVYTDFTPLTYIKGACKVNATGQRWINELADYNFTICYKRGVENAVADTLSRLPIRDAKDLEACLQLCCVNEFKSIFDGAVNQSCKGDT